MGDEESFLTLSSAGEVCGVDERETWVDRSAGEDDSLDCLVLQISRDSL